MNRHFDLCLTFSSPESPGLMYLHAAHRLSSHRVLHLALIDKLVGFILYACHSYSVHNHLMKSNPLRCAVYLCRYDTSAFPTQILRWLQIIRKSSPVIMIYPYHEFFSTPIARWLEIIRWCSHLLPLHQQKVSLFMFGCDDSIRL